MPTDILRETTYPSSVPSHRRADFGVHLVGLGLIILGGAAILIKSFQLTDIKQFLSVLVYVACALVSNLASFAYHFLPCHDRRKLLRRIDHAAIYLSITGTFTPFFVLGNTTWTVTLMWVCWGLTALAVWNKVTNETIKSRWSTASYLALGAIGLSAMPDLGQVPISTLWCVVAGAFCYVTGTFFYALKSMPFRYAIWHTWVNLGGVMMFIGIWIALF